MRRGQMKRKGWVKLKLTEKQRLYVIGVRSGLSRRRAALYAGYSPSSANNPGFNIERRGRGGNPTLRYFWDMLKPPQQARDSDKGGNGTEGKRQYLSQVQQNQRDVAKNG